MKKVLSIDWDFFQNVSVDTLRNCYPDGHDFPTGLSEMIWGSHYASDDEELESITVLKEEYDAIRAILLNQKKDCSVLIANSHLNAYSFILDNIDDDEKIQLVNIDMHHDFVNSNDDVDCGNWIGNLIEKGTVEKNGFKWINNRVSFEMYGLDKDDGIKGFKKAVNKMNGGNTVKVIKDEQYDMIVLARSDIWSVPHLDKYFCSLVEDMKKHFDTILMEKGIDKPRTEYMDIAQSLRETYEKMKGSEFDIEMG